MNSPAFIHNPLRLLPTDEQLAIQTATARSVLIEAVAGAAKTTTLALCIAEALARGTRPERILALTFTEPARHVLRQRLLQEIEGAPSLVREIRIESFESFASEHLARQVDDYWVEGTKRDVRRVSAAEKLRPHVHRAAEMVRERWGDRLAVVIRDDNIEVHQFLQAAYLHKAKLSREAPEFEDLSNEERAQALGVPLMYLLLLTEYERVRGAFAEAETFRGPGDATYDLARRLKRDPSLASNLQTFDLVVVDEMHDLNAACFEVMTAVAAGPKTWFRGVGDRDQVIHGYQGADPIFMTRERLAQAFGTRVVAMPLSKTFRYGPALAEVVQHTKGKLNTSGRAVATNIEVLAYRNDDPLDCADKVAAAIGRAMKGKRHALKTAILLRHADPALQIEAALVARDIPYRTYGLEPLPMRTETLFVRGLLSIALKNLGEAASEVRRREIVEALATFLELGLSATQINESKLAISREPDALQSFYEGWVLRKAEGALGERLQALIARVRDPAAATDAADFLAGVFDLLDIEAVAARLFVDRAQADDVGRSLRTLVRICRARALTARDLSTWLATEDRKHSRRESADLGLWMIEEAKGNEFDFVLLPYLSREEFSPEGSGKAEEENLFYVAITRTRDTLLLLVPDADDAVSQFVPRMRLAAAKRRQEFLLRAAGDADAGTAAARAQYPVFLKVPSEAFDVARGLGARYCRVRRKLYVPEGVALAPFKIWT